MHRRGICILAIALSVGTAATPISAGAAEDDSELWDVMLENDMLGGGDDGYYTHGTTITRRSATVPRWLSKAARRLPCIPCRDPQAVAYEGGQSIYTPLDTWRSDLIPEDRPYAGWLYLGARLSADSRARGLRRDSVGLMIGVVGPAAGAEHAQTLIHERRNLDPVRGWDHQLKNEPGFILDYSRSWPRVWGEARRLSFGTEPYVVGAVGNVRSYLGSGMTLRTVLNLGASGTSRSKAQLFMTFEVRRVLQDIFLDGNTRAASHRVAKLPVVGEARVGLSWRMGRIEITLAQTLRSREFRGQIAPDRYGWVSIAYRP